VTDGSKGDTRDKVAKATGKKASSLAKAEKVIDAAEAEPEKFAPLVEEMDRTGKVDGAYKQLKASKASPADIAKADRAEQTAAAKLAASLPKLDAGATASKPGDNPVMTAAELSDLIGDFARNVGATVARMGNDERTTLMMQLARANGFLNMAAREIARAGGANLGKLAPVNLRFEALEFLHTATARIEAELGTSQ
jgi:hypothetical protein